MFSLMLFMFLFFIGFLAAYYYLLKKIDDNSRQLSEECAQIRVLVRAAESRLDRLTKENETCPESAAQEETAPCGRDPLLHLSFEEPPKPDMELRLDEPPAK